MMHALPSNDGRQASEGDSPHLPWSSFSIGLGMVLLLSLPAVAPLLTRGYFASHDGMLHLYRLMGLDTAIAQGVFYPRWFPEFAFGYGHPVLNYYGVLPYFLAELFVVPSGSLILGMKALYALAIMAAGAAMYLFAYESFGRRMWPAALAGLAYVYAPYHLADAYVRGAAAELLAFVWFPLILLGFEWVTARRHAGILLLTLSTAGLLTTHALSLLIFAPFAALYALVTLIQRRESWRAVLSDSAIAVALGLLLSAGYWVPMVLERGAVGLASGASAGYRDHLAPLSGVISPGLLYHYFPDQGTPAEHPAGLVFSIMAALGFLGMIVPWRAQGLSRRLPILMGLGTLLGLFMSSAASLPLWKAFEPALSYLQYPWRFMALHAFCGSILIGGLSFGAEAAWGARRGRHMLLPTLSLLAVGVLILSALAALPYQQMELRDADISSRRMWAEEREAGQIGTTWTGEYLPVWVAEQRWAIGRSWLEAGGPDINEAETLREPDDLRVEGIRRTWPVLTAKALAPSALVLHQFYFPGMGARIEGVWTPAEPFGTLGLASIPLPAGQSRVEWDLRPTLARRAGPFLSLLGAVLLAVFMWRARMRRGVAISAGVLALALGLFFVRDMSVPNISRIEDVGAELEGKAQLVAAGLPSRPAHAGESVEVALFWLARRGFEEDLVSFVHLVPAGGIAPVAQSDQQPDGGFTPTTRWVAGEIIPDRHQIPLPADLPAGEYALYAGMYHFPSMDSLEILAARRPLSHGRVLVGVLEIVGP